MAYLDPSDVFLAGAAWPVLVPDDFPLEVAEPASFDHTEWAVIALARTDGLATLREARRSRFGRLIFGRPRRYALAAERLEALRRIAVEAWARPQGISLPALGAFIATGFTSAQLALLLSATGAMPAVAGGNTAVPAAIVSSAASGHLA